MKNIAINCRILNKRHGGPKRFLLNVLENFTKLDNKNNFFLLLDKNYDFDFELPDNFRKVVLKTKSRILFEYLHLPFYSFANRIDTYFVCDSVFSPLIKAKKKITIIHDIIYFEKGHEREFKFFENLHHRVMIKITGFFSDRSICVSEFTKSRVSKLLKLRNTAVILGSVEDKFKAVRDAEKEKEIIKKYDLKLPFIFYIGSLSPRKNPTAIIRSFNAVKDKIPHNLYLFVGYSWRDKKVCELLKNLKHQKRIFKEGFVDEDDLPTIYNLADLYLYPSLYEGFGLPILEAQACGCPVLTSNVSSCPEVAGEGAHIVDPYSEEEIAKGILKVVSEEDHRKKIVEKGFENIKRFSWERSARQLLEEFEK